MSVKLHVLKYRREKYEYILECGNCCSKRLRSHFKINPCLRIFMYLKINLLSQNYRSSYNPWCFYLVFHVNITCLIRMMVPCFNHPLEISIDSQTYSLQTVLTSYHPWHLFSGNITRFVWMTLPCYKPPFTLYLNIES